MGKITKLQNIIGGLQTTLAEKNKLIGGFTATVKQLTASCDAATKALTDAQKSIAKAEEAVKRAAK